MKVSVIGEYGYEQAVLGLSLSYNASFDAAAHVADKLFHHDGGHNKFLESICIWLDVTAPRYWWQQFDTYRIGVTKQSESTMHSIVKRFLTQEDFESPIPEIILITLNNSIFDKDFELVKAILPESFLQRRIICTNYKAIRHILKQRLTHRLPQWQHFVGNVYEQLTYRNFLTDLVNDSQG